jgi:hypothetical protein
VERGRITWLARGGMCVRSGAKRIYSSGVVFQYQFYCSFILVTMIVAVPDVVVAIATRKKLIESGLPILQSIYAFSIRNPYP